MAKDKPVTESEKSAALIRLYASIKDSWSHYYVTALSMSDIRWLDMNITPAFVYWDGKKIQIRLATSVVRDTIAAQQHFVKHELWHFFLGHLTNRYHELLFSDRERTNIAQDISIHECVEVPSEVMSKYGGFTAEKYGLERNKTTEFYYHALENNSNIPKRKTITLEELEELLKNPPKPGDGPGVQIEIHDVVQGKPMEEHDQQEVLKKIGQLAGTMPGELQMALNREKRINFGILMKLMDQMVDPTGGKGVKKTWAYKNKRNPSFRGHIRRMMSRLFVLFDSSGSVFTPQELGVFASALQGMKEYCKLFVGVCDADLHETFWFNGTLPKISGGGGTVFHKAFELAEEMRFTNMVILTDGYCDYPNKTKVKNVLWGIIDNKDFQPAYGHVIHLR